MVGWIKKIYEKRWMVGWIKKYEKNMDGWIIKKYEKNRWMVGWKKIYMDGWMDRKNI